MNFLTRSVYCVLARIILVVIDSFFHAYESYGFELCTESTYVEA